jgi:hypothetical protein
MFITVDILKEVGACGSGILWFRKNFPNGAELSEVATHEYIITKPSLLHWCRDNLSYTKEEEELYYFKPLNIVNSQAIERCQDISNSSYIAESKNISNSARIFKCTDITESTDVVASDEVNDSKLVFNSNFVYNSQKVTNSVNVNDSQNIVNSKYILKSNNVFQSTSITRSGEIYNSKNLKDCYFCFNCFNLKNAMFCSELTEGEYLLFNQPIDKEEFDVIKKQYNLYMKYLLEYVDEWPEEIYHFTVPRVNPAFSQHLNSIGQKFWKWVSSLPNYDPMYMFRLTCLPEFLTK